MTLPFRIILLAAIALFGTSHANAQSQSELVNAFAGDWYVFDPDYAVASKPCQIMLSVTKKGDEGLMKATAMECRPGIVLLDAWSVADGVLRLFDPEREMWAELGGSQRRLSGIIPSAGLGIVMERANGDGTSQGILEALQRNRCYFSGLNNICADASELRVPDFGATPDDFASIEMLVDLKVRSEPRRDAPVAGTLAKGNCISVNQCLTASDGIWCRARFGETNAWIPKVVLRQSQWAVTTFKNTCTPQQAD